MANPQMVKGNQLAKGNRGGGRKTLDKELIDRAIKLKKEEIAKELHNSELLDMKEKGYTHEQMKDFVMPIVVKGMVEKKELSGSVEIKQITGMNIQSDDNSIQNKDKQTD